MDRTPPRLSPHPPLEWIAFDADDTLWENELHYRRAKEAFADLLAGRRSGEEIRRRLDEVEVDNIRSYGYGIKSFILSMVETALELSDEVGVAERIGRILEMAKGMLAAEVQLFAGVEATLAQLAGHYELLLITKGDLHEQHRKIRGSGLAGYFRHVEIVAEKTVETYAAMLERYRIDPQRFLMVGNSLRSDILPVLALGGWAVYIHNENTWFHELTGEEAPAGPRYIELERIEDLPAYLEG